MQYGRDAKGRVNLVQTKSAGSVGAWTVLADSIAYEPFGSVKAMRLGDGLSAANDWGNDGRLTGRKRMSVALAISGQKPHNKHSGWSMDG